MKLDAIKLGPGRPSRISDWQNADESSVRQAARQERDASTCKRKVEQLLRVTVADGESPTDYVRARCLALLADEIKDDPDGRGYSAMSDADIAREINEGHTVVKKIKRPSRLAVVCFPDPAPKNPRSIADLLGDSVIGPKVRDELERDPTGLGYREFASDDNDQDKELAVLALLTDTKGEITTVYPSRIPGVFHRVPFAPNAIDAEDVAAAKAGG